MSYLIDTCALSELIKPSPEKSVVRWFNATASESLFLSTLTLGEIRKGVELLQDARRRSRIASWLEVELPAWFEDRILPIDAQVADEWGRMAARQKKQIPAIDGLLAATALRHRLVVVTRNRKDFALAGVEILDPWTF
ncbi:MAG: type II toxin-antitoxin system VapC family toxin [Alphaproteobacteria bacterium]|nr:type II toxin-antitoxin system VapC family toxin [Alphaproteobacteria bacterium]